MKRAPNTNSPEEVRRAIQRLGADADSQSGRLDDIDTSISLIESGVSSLDSRVDAIEAAAGYSAESDDAILFGQPIYIKASGHAALVVADDPAKIHVVGFALASTNPTFSVPYATEGKLTLVDWTAVAGVATLTPGSAYYLDTATGRIASVAPATGYIVHVGRATSTVTLDIEIESPIRL